MLTPKPDLTCSAVSKTTFSEFIIQSSIRNYCLSELAEEAEEPNEEDADIEPKSEMRTVVEPVGRALYFLHFADDYRIRNRVAMNDPNGIVQQPIAVLYRAVFDEDRVRFRWSQWVQWVQMVFRLAVAINVHAIQPNVMYDQRIADAHLWCCQQRLLRAARTHTQAHCRYAQCERYQKNEVAVCRIFYVRNHTSNHKNS